MNRTPSVARLIILAGAVLASLHGAARAQNAVKAEITRNYRAIEKAAKDKRPAGIIAFWTADYHGYLEDPKKHPLLDRKAAEKQLRGHFPGNDQSPHYEHTIRSAQVSPDGKTATVMVKVYSIIQLPERDRLPGMAPDAPLGNMDGDTLEKHTWVKSPQGWRLKTQEFVNFLGD